MIAEEHHRRVVEHGARGQLLQIVAHLAVHGGRIADVVVAERVRPEQAERRLADVGVRKVDGILEHMVDGVLVAEAVGERVSALFVQILLGRHHVRPQIVVGGRVQEAALVVVERADGHLVLAVCGHVAGVAERRPDEGARVEAAGFGGRALCVGQCVVEAEHDGHQVGEGVVVDLLAENRRVKCQGSNNVSIESERVIKTYADYVMSCTASSSSIVSPWHTFNKSTSTK